VIGVVGRNLDKAVRKSDHLHCTQIVNALISFQTIYTFAVMDRGRRGDNMMSWLLTSVESLMASAFVLSFSYVLILLSKKSNLLN